ncbi:hypothetical protein Ddye_003749 [Dipteronia dyeriana]|uniref:TF-B3 domain-containing protein n=1 Tax=Dipteronia dyeriana TaxID=168575 RepID=A0AAD9XTB5_9ROSI|nr:hypothetical protein Ddye_003749 [Dipteronia dyeriana]
MVTKKSSENANRDERAHVASQRRPKKNLPLIPVPENNIFQMAGVTQEDYRPMFFKIILGSIKERLRIPPKFLHHILKDLTKTATLKISSGDIWTVEMKRSKDGVFMEDGWQQFLRDNSLTDKHFLVFNYDGNMSFSVQIFEPNCVERVYDAATHCTKMPPPKEAAGHLNNGKRPRGRPKKNPAPEKKLSRYNRNLAFPCKCLACH